MSTHILDDITAICISMANKIPCALCWHYHGIKRYYFIWFWNYCETLWNYTVWDSLCFGKNIMCFSPWPNKIAWGKWYSSNSIQTEKKKKMRIKCWWKICHPCDRRANAHLAETKSKKTHSPSSTGHWVWLFSPLFSLFRVALSYATVWVSRYNSGTVSTVHCRSFNVFTWASSIVFFRHYLHLHVIMAGVFVHILTQTIQNASTICFNNLKWTRET